MRFKEREWIELLREWQLFVCSVTFLNAALLTPPDEVRGNIFIDRPDKFLLYKRKFHCG
jgi:hypothetical protein